MYWGLRDYGTGTWEGGEQGCDHRQPGTKTGAATTLRMDGRAHLGPYEGERALTVGYPFRDLCGKCGARRIDQQIGLEPTPEAWAARLVEVFREVRRVLRPDGVCFVNIGDSYASTSTYNAPRTSGGEFGRVNGERQPNNGIPAGLKPKDLVGQPWLLAFALRADGWWLRSEIIWAKPNPMPESVTDRPTKAHEQVFLLTKSARYFWDAEAVREALSDVSLAQIDAARRLPPSELLNGKGLCSSGQVGSHTDGRGDATGLLARQGRASRGHAMNPAGRNLRSVWQIATEPFPEAHFATFPTGLARRCILAGTSAKGCCPECGAPWSRVVERETYREIADTREMAKTPLNVVRAGWRNGGPQTETLGWRPSCACDAGEPQPCTVLDCFGGSGTVGLVADELGRDAVLIELSPAFAEMCERRLAKARARRMLGDAPRFEALPGQLGLFA